MNRTWAGSVNIQSLIRKIHQRAAHEGLMPIKMPRTIRRWIKNTSVMDEYKTDGDFETVVKSLEAMKAMNEKYYAASVRGFFVRRKKK
jgi:hypothetical protein